MKANEAPEKLYIALNELTEDGCTFVLDHRVDYPICTEYTRTDAFIQKACDAFCKVCRHYPHTVPTHICRQDCDYFKDFKRYMKRE